MYIIFICSVKTLILYYNLVFWWTLILFKLNFFLNLLQSPLPKRWSRYISGRGRGVMTHWTIYFSGAELTTIAAARGLPRTPNAAKNTTNVRKTGLTALERIHARRHIIIIIIIIKTMMLLMMVIITCILYIGTWKCASVARNVLKNTTIRASRGIRVLASSSSVRPWNDPCRLRESPSRRPENRFPPRPLSESASPGSWSRDAIIREPFLRIPCRTDLVLVIYNGRLPSGENWKLITVIYERSDDHLAFSRDGLMR